MGQESALELVRDLCDQLNAQGIAYCHWKSNAMLDRSASGANDLDLLIGRADGQRFKSIICQLGFKEAKPIYTWQCPGIAHHYAYDARSDRLVHLHAHYQLILGHDLLKNHHLPMERPFLESASQDELFKVPIPELELIVFAIRMVLKRPLFDLRRRRSLGSSESDELVYLRSRARQEQVHSVLSAHLPYVSVQLFEDCLRSLEPGCSCWTRMKTGWRLHRALGATSRNPCLVSFTMRMWRRYAGAIRARLTRSLPRKQMVNGGLLVALVGGDGAGKSTAVQELVRWLSKDFDVLQVHMGKPPRSWITFIVDSASRLVGWMIQASREKWGARQSADPSSYAWIERLQFLRCVSTARDRYRAYVRMRRFASNGGIVICDRYPLSQVRRMDAPRLRHLEETERTGHSLSRTVRILVQMERNYYRRIRAPEVLIVLRVAPDLAVRRKLEEIPESVRARSQEIWELDWRQMRAHVVDAGRSQSEVLSEIKSIVWAEL